jgi:hypothetical protein
MAAGIQSIVFYKDKWTLPASRKWLEVNGFKTAKVDETATLWRWRQRDPDDFSDYRMGQKIKGIRFVWGIK